MKKTDEFEKLLEEIWRPKKGDFFQLIKTGEKCILLDIDSTLTYWNVDKRELGTMPRNQIKLKASWLPSVKSLLEIFSKLGFDCQISSQIDDFLVVNSLGKVLLSSFSPSLEKNLEKNLRSFLKLEKTNTSLHLLLEKLRKIS